jgi:hypothetical protein
MEAQHAAARMLRVTTWNVNGLSRILKSRFINLENMLASLQAGKVHWDRESGPALPLIVVPTKSGSWQRSLC